MTSHGVAYFHQASLSELRFLLKESGTTDFIMPIRSSFAPAVSDLSSANAVSDSR